MPQSCFGFTPAPCGSQSHFLPSRLPASACLLLSWLSTYLNLLMKTCFTVQSTDSSSSLPKEACSQVGEASCLPEMGGWGLGGGGSNIVWWATSWVQERGWGLGAAGLRAGQDPRPPLAPGLQLLCPPSVIWMDEDRGP